jgi:hypothetical protein
MHSLKLEWPPPEGADLLVGIKIKAQTRAMFMKLEVIKFIGSFQQLLSS